ncbi:MFS transporter [Roseibium sp. RKSG952]|uniref:MFS transporter n=1 Tax=Roseibium sp. RKSG952 TaxID=2529384 RepID=UPI0012BCA034|nr:MFS transporter [Roseibium sp. RKSG952]MTH96345.1 MFS transporter [Roseibium sp. RKSG952]
MAKNSVDTPAENLSQKPNPAFRSKARKARLLLGHKSMVTTATTLANPRTILPYIFSALGGATFAAGLLVPFFQITTLIGAAIFAPLIAQKGQKHQFLVLGSLMGLFAISMVIVTATTAPTPIIVALAFFLSTGTLGIAIGLHKVAMGRAMTDAWHSGERQKFLSMSEVLAGIAGVFIALAPAVFFQTADEMASHIHLLWAAFFAIALGLIMAAAFSKSPSGSPANSTTTPSKSRKTLLEQARESYRILLGLAWFRRFLLMRATLISVQYGAVFYALHAAEQHVTKPESLPAFAAAGALGNLALGGITRISVFRNSRHCIMFGALTGLIAAAIALSMEIKPSINLVAVYSLVFFFMTAADGLIYIGYTAYYLDRIDKQHVENGLALIKLIVQPFVFVQTAILAYAAHLHHVGVPIVILAVIAVLGVLSAATLPGGTPAHLAGRRAQSPPETGKSAQDPLVKFGQSGGAASSSTLPSGSRK